MNNLGRDSHLRDHDLERYHLGMITDEAELAPFEEHMLACELCARRAEQAADYVDAVRAAACVFSEAAFGGAV